MDIVRPVTISDAQFVSSTVAENDFAVWSSATTYAAGTKVIVTAAGDHHIYESLQAANTNHNPKTSPTWWNDLGADNRWAMFDGVVGTKTTKADPIAVSVNPGAVNALALLELDAVSIDVSMVAAAVTIYSKTVRLEGAYVHDWYSYFFEPLKFKKTLVLTDLPLNAAATLSVTINNTGNTAGCGVLVAGFLTAIGQLQWKPTIGIIDYSTKEKDTFGNPTIVQRAYSKRMSCQLSLDNYQVDGVQNILSDYRATPVVWYGTELFDATTIYGFFKEFNILIYSPAGSTCTLEIEGLI